MVRDGFVASSAGGRWRTPQAATDLGGHLGQRGTLGQPCGPVEVGRQVLVAEVEPGRRGGRPGGSHVGVALPARSSPATTRRAAPSRARGRSPPASVYVIVSMSGEMRQPVQHGVVAGVDDRRRSARARTTSARARRKRAAPTPPQRTTIIGKLLRSWRRRRHPLVQPGELVGASLPREPVATGDRRRRSGGPDGAIARAPSRGCAASASTSSGRAEQRRVAGHLRDRAARCWRPRGRRPASRRAAGSRTPRRATGRPARVAWRSSHERVGSSTRPVMQDARRHLRAGGRRRRRRRRPGRRRRAPASTSCDVGVLASRSRRTRAPARGRFLRRSIVPIATTNGRPTSSAIGASGGGARTGSDPSGDHHHVARRAAARAQRPPWPATRRARRRPAATARRSTSPARRTSALSLARMAQEPAVVHRHHPRQPRRRHDVVGAVDDLAGASAATGRLAATADRDHRRCATSGRQREPRGRLRPGVGAEATRR